MRIALAFAVVSAAAVALGASVVSAQQNPIEARQALMKDNGKHAKMAAAMAKGEAPFDLAKAKEIFATFETAAQKMPALFPPDSKTGHDTTASPKIWENKLDFDAQFEKFGADAKKASATVTDLASFKSAFSAIGKDCGGCHETYRVKKN
jgi:cytochrome c556